MSLAEFAWLEIGMGLGLGFALAMLFWHRPTQRKWLRFLTRTLKRTENS